MTENLMMEGASRGGDRQVLHERIRIHAKAAADALKAGAAENDLFERIAADSLFGIDRASIEQLARPENYTGLSRQQTERFLTEEIDPIIAAEVTSIATDVAELRV
jgi:adenylosuccinate lyase